jgi:hypothetical protein
MQNIIETEIMRWSGENALANMMNLHTCTVCSVHLVVADVGLPHGKFIEVVGEVVCGSSVRVPCWIDRVGGSVALRCRCMCSSSLARSATVIVPDAKKLPLEVLEGA